VAAAYFLWPVPVLVVSRTGPAGELWSGSVMGGLDFRLDYIHSVERTPVAEFYEATPGGLRMIRMEFVSQGAGLPSTGYTLEGGRFVSRPDRRLIVLPIRVSRAAAPVLTVGGARLDLVARAGDGAEVTVALRRRPRLTARLRVLY